MKQFKDNLLDDGVSLIKLAIARVRLAHAEGDPILSAWVYDAERWLARETSASRRVVFGAITPEDGEPAEHWDGRVRGRSEAIAAYRASLDN